MEIAMSFLSFIICISLFFTVISLSIEHITDKNNNLSAFLKRFCREYKKEYGTEVNLISKSIFVSILIFSEFIMNVIITFIIFSIIVGVAFTWNILV